jgi:hypothetical protein
VLDHTVAPARRSRTTAAGVLDCKLKIENFQLPIFNAGPAMLPTGMYVEEIVSRRAVSPWMRGVIPNMLFIGCTAEQIVGLIRAKGCGPMLAAAVETYVDRERRLRRREH